MKIKSLTDLNSGQPATTLNGTTRQVECTFHGKNIKYKK